MCTYFSMTHTEMNYVHIYILPIASEGGMIERAKITIQGTASLMSSFISPRSFAHLRTLFLNAPSPPQRHPFFGLLIYRTKE